MSHSPPTLSPIEINNNKNNSNKLVVRSAAGGASANEQSAASGCEGASVDEPLVLNATQEFDDYLFKANTSNLTYNEKNNKHLNKRNKLLETREIETLTDICTSENLPEVEVFSLLDEKLPAYKLRADSIFSHSNCDWIKAPLYFDEQQISELTNEQIQFTLDYFILSGHRVSQMTKTYYDIEAVTKLLDEKEKDLELAATIGKQLLEKDQQLEAKIEFLENEVEKTTEMVNQLRHDITLKDNLLKTFIESESDNNFQVQLDDSSAQLSKVNVEALVEYKNKILCLEDENDLWKTKYECLEMHVTDMETKESVIIENCLRELDDTNYNLQVTQEELKEKTNLCTNQQEEIQNLFAQIFDLQLTIKRLTQNNNDLQSNYESSVSELIEQINDLKEKYNECLKQLSRTQEELLMVRKKYPNKQRAGKRLSSSGLINSTCIQPVEHASYLDDEDVPACGEHYLLDNEQTFGYCNSSRINQHSPHVPTNSNSLAAEVFCSLAKDFRTKNSNLPQQTSQSSEFIKKVKQKLTKQLPGSNVDSCLQSDSEIELMLSSFNSIMPGLNTNDLESSMNQPHTYSPSAFQSSRLYNSNSSQLLRQFTNCPTPESILSTGSASIYSNLVARSNSFMLPEKLQIVKPIEGSQTLQHWQHLARPNLGCLFETRPGISIKSGSHLADNGSNPLNKKTLKALLEEDKSFDSKLDYDFEEDDGVNLEMYDDDEDDNGEEDDEDLGECDDSDSRELEMYRNFDNQQTGLFYESFNTNAQEDQQYLDQRVLSPNRVELLSKLLENEEKNSYKSLNESRVETTKQNNSFFYDIFQKFSTKYFANKPVSAKETSPVRKKSKKKSDCDDPDTPPSSPINTPLNATTPNILYDVFTAAKLKCKSTFVEPLSNYFQNSQGNFGGMPVPGTPPGTPFGELDYEYIAEQAANKTKNNSDLNNNNNNSDAKTEKIAQSQNFFDQIVGKLSLFSFKSVTTPGQEKDVASSFIIKPKPVYPLTPQSSPINFKSSWHNDSNRPNEIFDIHLLNEKLMDNKKKASVDAGDIEPELVAMEIAKPTCETPPPSPSKFSPPLPLLDEDYNEENFRKSAFVKVASLNPYINKSIDLNSLLGSLSTLKRNQRICKY